MKTLWSFILLAIFLWCPPLSAEYCTVKSEDKQTSCIFKVDRIPHDSQIVISYTPQGWSMMISVFLKDFAMIEGDSKVETSKDEMHSMEYLSTRRDITSRGKMMEASVYLVNEELLHKLGNSRGKVRFWLTADDPKEVEVEVAADRFSDIDAYIAETKTVLGALFKDE